MIEDQVPLLSKSLFTSGLQCLKRLYLQIHDPELAPPPSSNQQAIFDAGTEVGVVAQRLFPGGARADADSRSHDSTVARTAALMDDPGVPAIFEAAFTQDGVRFRADILVRADQGAWDLIEVKSSTSVKPQYIDDIAIQLWALERTGTRVRRACVAHIDRTYVYQGGGHDPHGLFKVVDVSDEARARTSTIPPELDAMRIALRDPHPPVVEVGPQCARPYRCEFNEHCHADQVAWPIDELPGLNPNRRAALLESGVRSILDLVEADSISDLQRRVRDAVQTGKPVIGPLLGQALERIRPPIHFVDFETIGSAIPRYEGTRPFEAQAFQWSDHVVDESGAITHFEFLADGSTDPRKEFAESLLARLEGARTVVVYSGYESQQLRQIATAFPEFGEAVRAAENLDWVDLLQVIRTHYYHPAFHGSFSLKQVLPALVPELGYDDLAIQEGGGASLAFLASLDPATSSERRDALRADLLAYCRRDTEAMLHILAALRRAVA